MDAAVQSTELQSLVWSVILLILHIVVQTVSLVKDAGLSYAFSPRDEVPGLSRLTERLTRALRNFIETYPAFVGLALALVATGMTGGIGATGAALWFWARVVYVPVYAIGLPVVRTLVWLASIVGLVMMLLPLL